MFNIEHKYAIELEMLVRKAFKCERFGVSGLANSDHFDYEPFDAAIMIISYLYAKDLIDSHSQFETFIDKYDTIFKYLEENNANSEVENYINDLANIVEKYS